MLSSKNEISRNQNFGKNVNLKVGDNEIYMITHPNQELNTHLPDNIPSFGIARTFLLIYSSSAKASLNLMIPLFT